MDNREHGEGWPVDLDEIPGSEIVSPGLRDLRDGIITINSLLVLIAGPRLRRLGFEVPDLPVERPIEHRLYSLLEDEFGIGAYSRFNSLIRRIVSFSRALERERACQ